MFLRIKTLSVLPFGRGHREKMVPLFSPLLDVLVNVDDGERGSAKPGPVAASKNESMVGRGVDYDPGTLQTRLTLRTPLCNTKNQVQTRLHLFSRRRDTVDIPVLNLKWSRNIANSNSASEKNVSARI